MMHPIHSNDCETKWEAIDIFLFCNGQQYSPPRKYHLRNDELKWWDATLTYLARAQYGSVHSSIAMYTTNGSRVQTPLELNNGAAYVAVVPPDDFIAAGYDKYLVKASRSWEKSLQKKAEALQNSKEDVDRSVDKITNGKLQIENPIPLGSPRNLPESTEERKQSSSGSGGRSSFFSRRMSPNVKPSDIKKKNNKIPTPQTTRNSKNNSTTKSPTDSKRSSIRRKESGDDKNSKLTELGLTKLSINGTTTTVSKVVTSSIVTKDLQIQSNENEITDKKVSDTDKEVMFYRNPEKDALSSCFEASTTQQVTVANDDTKNNKTASQTRLEKISEESLKTEDILKNVIKHVIERVFTLNKTPDQAVYTERAVGVVDTKLCPASCNKNPNLVNNNEPIVTILKKGDTVNLKVNIEVINTEPVNKSTADFNFNKPETPPHEKRERGSQTNVNVEFNKTPPSIIKNNNQEQYTSQQSSLTRIFEKENYNQGNCFGTSPPQVVVLQCSCTHPDHSIAFNELHAINHTSKNLCLNNTKYILVPAEFLNEYQCCNCVQTVTGQRAETEIQEKRPEESAGIQDKSTGCLSCLKFTSSTTSVAVKTHTNTERVNCNEPDVKIAEHKDERSAKSSVVVTEDTFVIITPQPDPVIKNLDQNDVRRCCLRKEIGKGDIVAAEPTINAPEYVITKTYFDTDHTRREYIVSKHEIEDIANGKPSFIVKRQEDSDLISTDEQKTKFLVLRKQQQPKDLVDVSTQTYWCDTLLQTRINEDGHYSFHLPTLQILRQYKL